LQATTTIPAAVLEYVFKPSSRLTLADYFEAVVTGESSNLLEGFDLMEERGDSLQEFAESFFKQLQKPSKEVVRRPGVSEQLCRA